MNKVLRWMWIAFVITYVLSPNDFYPGTMDDTLVFVIVSSVIMLLSKHKEC